MEGEEEEEAEEGGERGGLGKGRLRGRLREGAGERPGRHPLQGTGRDRRVLETGPSRERRRGARGPSSSMPVTPGRKPSRRLGGRRPRARSGGGHRCHPVVRAGSAGLTACRGAGLAARAEAGLGEPDPRPRGARPCSELERGTSGHMVLGWPVPIRQAARCAPHPPVTGSSRPLGQGAAGEPTSVLVPQDGVRRTGEPRLRGAPAAPARLPSRLRGPRRPRAAARQPPGAVPAPRARVYPRDSAPPTGPAPPRPSAPCGKGGAWVGGPGVGGASSAQAHRRASAEEPRAAVTSWACARVLVPLESGTRVAVCESLPLGD